MKQALFNIKRTVRTLSTQFNYSDYFHMNFGLRPRFSAAVAPTVTLGNQVGGSSEVFAIAAMSAGTDAVSVSSGCFLIKAPIRLLLQERLMRTTTPSLFPQP